MSELDPISFFQYILKDRVKVDEQIIPVIVKLKEKIELPFITSHLTHNRQLPYTLSTFAAVDGSTVKRSVMRLHEYTIDILIYANTVKERDEILQQVIDLTRKAQRNHYIFCRKYHESNCAETMRECDARRIHSADSPFAACPYWNVVDEESPNFRGPTSPLHDFNVFSIQIGRWDHDLDANHKPPVYIARQEIVIIIKQTEGDVAPLYTGFKVLKD